ncbi:MAG: biotin--[acetyl-CoA-carboxylase] ligase [Kiritimatiellaeota bacterium]|nr:biotin--[acetyl-CoA-carboxylase] ligase [Kiritimatiellota bacterium]
MKVVEVTGSTNEDALKAAAAGAAEGWAIASLSQTAGRGRLGRAWQSPKGGVYVSVILRPAHGYGITRIPLMAGCAMAEAIATMCCAEGACVACFPIKVKWPNDVLVNGRKVTGILTESRDGAVIVGAGVNITTAPADLPVRQQYPASSLLAETGTAPDPLTLAETWIDCLLRRYTAPDGLGDWPHWDALYGNPVRVNTLHGLLEGTGQGIAPDGALLLSRDNTLEPILAGDILP